MHSEGTCSRAKELVILIMGRGATKREGRGHVKFCPYEKGGRKSFSQLNGGHNKFWGSFYEVA